MWTTAPHRLSLFPCSYPWTDSGKYPPHLVSHVTSMELCPSSKLAEGSQCLIQMYNLVIALGNGKFERLYYFGKYSHTHVHMQGFLLIPMVFILATWSVMPVECREWVSMPHPSSHFKCNLFFACQTTSVLVRIQMGENFIEEIYFKNLKLYKCRKIF